MTTAILSFATAGRVMSRSDELGIDERRDLEANPPFAQWSQTYDGVYACGARWCSPAPHLRWSACGVSATQRRIDPSADARLLRSPCGGQRAGEALRWAQLRMLYQPGTSHPFYWAAFIPAGDWRPLDASVFPPQRPTP